MWITGFLTWKLNHFIIDIDAFIVNFWVESFLYLIVECIVSIPDTRQYFISKRTTQVAKVLKQY